MQLAGIKEGDFIVDIAGIDVKWYTHQEIVSLVQSTGSSCLEMKIITPMDRNYLKVCVTKGGWKRAKKEFKLFISYSPLLVPE